MAFTALVALGGHSSVAQAKDGPPALGYSAGFLTDPFQAVLVEKSLAAAKAAGMTTVPAANANGDAAKQNSDVHNVIAAGATVLLVNPTDSRAILPALAFAATRNVPVVAIDTAPAGGKVAMIIRADNAQMGEEACQTLGAAIGGKGTVLSLMGDQATTNGRDRTTGFDECLKSKFPAIKLIEEPTNWKPEKAAAIAQTIITSTPALSGIYLQSDSVMLAGVINVLRSAGKLHPTGEQGHIALVSIDGSALALRQIRAGYLDAAISQPLDMYVKYAVAAAQNAAAGKPVPLGPTDHHSTIVAYHDNPMDLLPSLVVTKANVDDPSLWGNEGHR